jgi:hypothetical protein
MAVNIPSVIDIPEPSTKAGSGKTSVSSPVDMSSKKKSTSSDSSSKAASTGAGMVAGADGRQASEFRGQEGGAYDGLEMP